MPRHATKLKLTAAVLTSALLTVGLSGCNKTQSTDTLLAEAAAYQQKGDIKAALIQLKNAVANSPEDGAARLALGTLQMSSGDNVSAEKELGRARSLGVPAEQVLPVLGKTLAQQGKFKEVLALITPCAATHCSAPASRTRPSRPTRRRWPPTPIRATP
jgi:Tfp pilus assembly protein PilF